MSASLANACQPPSPDVRRLVNGLPVSLLSQPWLGRAAVCVRVGAGSHDEPLEYPGLAHFLEHMLFLDCVGFTGDQRLMPFVLACGGQVNATTQARHTEFFFEVPADQLEGALQRLLTMLTHPLLSEAEQAREREVVHAEFVARCQDADTLISAALGQALAAGHRFGDFVAGNRDTLSVDEAGFQHALRAFHLRFYHAGNCQLSIVGPQPVEELYALAQQVAGALPERPLDDDCPVAPMLPLRFQHARLALADDSHRVHIGYALELPAACADDAVALLQSWLMSEQAGGLLAELREAEVGRALQVRVVYAEGGQTLLLLTLSGVPKPERALAFINDWLSFMSERADVNDWLESYRLIKGFQRASQGPLLLARNGAALAAGEGAPCDLHTLSVLLEQLQQPQRQVVITTQAEPLLQWPESVFPLYMARERALAVPKVYRAWGLPSANPLLVKSTDHTPLPQPAQLCWLPAPVVCAQQANPQAVWLARFSFVDALGSDVLLRLAQTCLQALIQQAAQVGIDLQLNAQKASLELRIHGHSRLLPRVIETALRQLLEPDAHSWQMATAPASTNPAMPIRKLLALSTEMTEPFTACELSKDVLLTRYRSMQMEALGVGFDRNDEQVITGLLPNPAASNTASMPIRTDTSVQWRLVPAEGEAALLLFCPQPDASAQAEAAWRVLAQLHQSAFYQRLRSELQLGYAVFCQYRQIQGRRGLLFGVQSPHLSASAILEHIQAFLQVRSTWLEQLSEADLQSACASLDNQWQLQRHSVEGLAEQCWQARMAGLPQEHSAAVQAELKALSLADVCAAQRALSEGVGGRFVLSNQQQCA
jgi:coenzyme PQQ biosynthesis probable peptidase PqqF